MRVMNKLFDNVFEDENGQALRIPKGMETDSEELEINKLGDVYVAYPSADPWASVREVIGTFSSGFMEDREQPSWADVTEREEL